MERKVKSLLVLSAVALIATGCSSTNGTTNSPFGQSAQNADTGAGVTHTHNGVAHTHPLPETGLAHTHNFNTGSATTCVPCGTTNNVVTTTSTATSANQGTCHAHDGRTHCHPLPASGVNHTHNTGTEASGAAATDTTYYDYSGGQATAPAADTTTYYDYGATVTQKGVVTHSHNGVTHSHVLPAAGLNHTHTAGVTSIGSTYETYATGGTTATTSNANVYTVQKGDTVFQVMRNTGVYWKDIIKLNNLQAPGYTIVPGQQLKLR